MGSENSLTVNEALNRISLVQGFCRTFYFSFLLSEKALPDMEIIQETDGQGLPEMVQ